MYISDFSCLKLHHRDFCKTYWEIYTNYEIIKNKKSANFLGHFSNRVIWIWQIKNISRWSAWKNEENVHLRFVIFKLPHKDICQTRWEICKNHISMEHMKIGPFLGCFPTRKKPDMANKKYIITISTKK